MDIYQKMKALGCEIGHHESDLYVPVTPETTRIVEQYEFKGIVTTFAEQQTGKPWYSIPFAYSPYWERKEEERARRGTA
jgi:hypothetical protein